MKTCGLSSLLLAVLPITVLAVQATGVAPQPLLVYVGTYTDGASRGIYAFRFDLRTGRVTPLGLAAAAANPEFLAVHPDGGYLYSTNEVDAFETEDGRRVPTGSVSAFAIDPRTGLLTLLNRVSSGGPGPAYVSLDRTARFALVANYTGGSVAALPIRDDGSLGEAACFVQHEGSSVNRQRQTGPHAHCIRASNDNRFALAADLGLDKVLVYRFDGRTGTLTPNAPSFISTAPGAGPRHLAFHPRAPYVFVANELASTVSSFAWEGDAGVLRELQTVSTLPSDFRGGNWVSEILVHPGGRILYVGNRGRDSIASFAIDLESGRLRPVEEVPTGGRNPRGVSLDPTGRWLFVANQASGEIRVFRVDPDTGRLTPSGEVLKVDKPIAIAFAPVGAQDE